LGITEFATISKVRSSSSTSCGIAERSIGAKASSAPKTAVHRHPPRQGRCRRGGSQGETREPFGIGARALLSELSSTRAIKVS
jgi:hypothetical protein